MSWVGVYCCFRRDGCKIWGWDAHDIVIRKGKGRLGMLSVSRQHCHGVRRSGLGCSLEWLDGRIILSVKS